MSLGAAKWHRRIGTVLLRARITCLRFTCLCGLLLHAAENPAGPAALSDTADTPPAASSASPAPSSLEAKTTQTTSSVNPAGVPTVHYRFYLELPSSVPATLRMQLEQSLDLSIWLKEDRIPLTRLRQMLEDAPSQLENLLAPLGYFNSTSTLRWQRSTTLLERIGQAVRRTPPPDNKPSPPLEAGDWDIFLSLNPGPRARIGAVELNLEGSVQAEVDYLQRLTQLREDWPLPVGENFTQTDWDNAKEHALAPLVANRFPLARIRDRRARVDVGTTETTVQLGVVIDSGPLIRFGAVRIESLVEAAHVNTDTTSTTSTSALSTPRALPTTRAVEGLIHYPRTVIDRLITLNPGDPYRQDALFELQQALLQMPYFASVVVSAEPHEGQASVPVLIQVRERHPAQIDTSLGYSTEKGWRVGLGYTDFNLFGTAWVGTVATVQQQYEQSYAIGLQLPWTSARTRYQVNYLILRQNYQSTDILSQAPGIQRITARGRIEETQALQYVRTREQQGEVITSVNNALILSESWSYRNLDNPVDPHRGVVLNLQLGGATRHVVSDANFLRSVVRSGVYLPLWGESLLFLRGEGGYVLTLDAASVPANWLFRTGGASSVRGYSYQSLGVAGANGAVVGGKVLGVLSAEYQFPVYGDWRLALFSDQGNAANDGGSFHWYRGNGFGVRWSSPVGIFGANITYGVDFKQWRGDLQIGTIF